MFDNQTQNLECHAATACRDSADWQRHGGSRTSLRRRGRRRGFAQVARAHQGGLLPKTLRRVRDYVEAHLGEKIDNTKLASIAGLSMFHFVHAFKQSQSVSPHEYVMRRPVGAGHGASRRHASSAGGSRGGGRIHGSKPFGPTLPPTYRRDPGRLPVVDALKMNLHEQHRKPHSMPRGDKPCPTVYRPC